MYLQNQPQCFFTKTSEKHKKPRSTRKIWWTSASVLILGQKHPITTTTNITHHNNITWNETKVQLTFAPTPAAVFVLQREDVNVNLIFFGVISSLQKAFFSCMNRTCVQNKLCMVSWWHVKRNTFIFGFLKHLSPTLFIFFPHKCIQIKYGIIIPPPP